MGTRILLTKPLDGAGTIPIKHIGAPVSADDAARLQDITSAIAAITVSSVGTAGVSIVASGAGPAITLRSIEAASTRITVALDSPNNAISIEANVGTTNGTLAAGDDSRFFHARYLDTATSNVGISAAAQPSVAGQALVTAAGGATATWQTVILSAVATVTPTANSIPLSGAGTTINVGWIQQASTTVFGTVEYSASTPAVNSYAGAANTASLLVPTAGHQHPAGYAKGLYLNAGAATVDTTAAATPTTAGQILSTTAAGTAAFAAGPTTSNQVPLSSGAGAWAWGTVTAGPGPANAFVTSTTNVTIVATAPTGAGQALVTTSTTSSTWTTVATMNTTVPTGLTLGGLSAAGTGTTAAHVDHTHSIPSLTSGQVITALGYTPVQGTGSNGVVPKFTSTASTITASQISDDGSTVSIGTIANAVVRVNGGTTSVYIGQLSDNTGYAGFAVAPGGISNSNFVIACNITTGTILNANSGKTIYFNVANVNYASVTSAGIAAINISATPGASKIPIADGSGTLNSWVTRAASYVSLLRIPPTGFADGYGWISNSTAIAIGSVYLSPTLFPYPTRVVHIVAQSMGTSGACTWTLYDIANGATVAATGTIAFNAAAGITMFQQPATLTGTGLYQLNVSVSGDTKIMILSANFINAP